jgi:hypothetical protein
MHEPPKSKQLPGNPYADYAQQHMDPALAWEIRTLIMLEHPHVGHEQVEARMKEQQ